MLYCLNIYYFGDVSFMEFRQFTCLEQGYFRCSRCYFGILFTQLVDHGRGTESLCPDSCLYKASIETVIFPIPICPVNSEPYFHVNAIRRKTRNNAMWYF